MNMKPKLTAAALAAAVIVGASAANAVTPLKYDQNAGGVTAPSDTYNVVADFPNITAVGSYRGYLVFDVTSPQNFNAVLSELDQGTNGNASYFAPGSYIELFKCSAAVCGAIATSAAPSSVNFKFKSAYAAPTGTLVAGTMDLISPRLFSTPGGGWSQDASSSAKNLADGWYFYELVGTVNAPDHTAMQIYGGVALSSIPEPSTWAMLGIGFAGIGLLGVTNRRKAPRYAL
jgi:hypothetical protein